MARVCAITMARNDDFFLKRWVKYYGSQLGRENLYVYLDGKDQHVPDECEGANFFICDKLLGNRVRGDKLRISFLCGKAHELLNRYDYVIGTDADEFLIVDPLLGMTLPEYIASYGVRTTLSGLGVDVGQHLEFEGKFDNGRGFLEQRSYARLSTRYTKASIIAKKVRWGSGFHRVKGHNYHIGKGLYLFHMGYFDMERVQNRFSDRDHLSSGWTKHLQRRARTIYLVSSRKARAWDKWTGVARWIQTVFRPIYAINKPAMFEAVLIVRIPERFKNII